MNTPQNLYVAGVGRAKPEKLAVQLSMSGDEAATRARDAEDKDTIQKLTEWLQSVEQGLGGAQQDKLKVLHNLLQSAGQLGGACRSRPGVVLRGGIAMAILFREKAHLDLVGVDDRPLFADSQEFTGWLAQLIGLGESQSRLSNLRRACDLWLILHELELPVPLSPDPLIPLISLELQSAVEIYGTLCRQLDGGVPETKAIKDAATARKTRKIEQPLAPVEGVGAGLSAKSWRQEALGRVKELRLWLLRCATDGAEAEALALVTYLKAKYDLAGDRIARKRQRVHLASLSFRQGGVKLGIDQKSRALHVRLDRIKDEALRHEIHQQAIAEDWKVDHEGDLYFELSTGPSKRMAEVAGKQKWLHDLKEELNSRGEGAGRT